MIEIGKINTLTILRETTVGLYLGDEDKNDVLLPNSFIKDNYKISLLYNKAAFLICLFFNDLYT